MTPPIINVPHRQGRGRRTFFRMLTAAAWIAYLYLWLPLATLVAWAAGVNTAYGQMYLKQHAVDPFLLLALPLIALGCAVVVLGWGEYNRARFGGEDRRRPMAPVGQAEVALALGADAATAALLRDGRIVFLILDEEARPIASTARARLPEGRE